MKLNIASTRVVKMYFLCISWHDTFGVTVLLRYRKDMQRHSEIQQKFLWCCLVPQTTLCCQETASAGEEKYSTNTMRTEEASREDMSLSRRELETRRCLGGVHVKKKKNEGIYFCFYVRYQFHVVTTLCIGAARLGFRQNTRSGWGRDDVLALLVPSPQKQLENIPTSRQKSLVLSRIQMLRHHVEEWCLAWKPSHPVVTPTPSPSGHMDM